MQAGDHLAIAGLGEAFGAERMGLLKPDQTIVQPAEYLLHLSYSVRLEIIV